MYQNKFYRNRLIFAINWIEREREKLIENYDKKNQRIRKYTKKKI